MAELALVAMSGCFQDLAGGCLHTSGEQHSNHEHIEAPSLQMQ